MDDERRAALDLDRARFGVGVLAVVHFAVAVALVPFALLEFALATYPTVDEWTDLSVLAPAVQWVLLGTWLPVLVTPVLAFAMVRRSSDPWRRFWIAPAVGIAATIALHVLPYLFFPAPQPAVGG
ncbi:hypothetical protein [Rathayibacter sp. Leaf296]|uniref:hypothetical protein n=1 Tax=Rathayibacter sp. Leaf296 TaxID=1736327 RepID=UPI0007038A16|nr:hypothetical protein [Rathayibacter sp. Leaf296]KQQ08276.1 hypothetical protein ASF46_13185 [Rathayibacter sp. Leaf296]